MLCLVFFSAVLSLHVYKARCTDYRRLRIHDKINICYHSIISLAPACLVFASPHYVLQHLAVLRPRHPTILLWLVPESAAFNIILAAHMLTHDYAALLLALMTPLSVAEGFVVVALLFADRAQLYRRCSRHSNGGHY